VNGAERHNSRPLGCGPARTRGFITDTTGLHAASWKEVFDAFLQKRAAERGEDSSL
jgi:hypothetical protein